MAGGCNADSVQRFLGRLTPECPPQEQPDENLARERRRSQTKCKNRMSFVRVLFLLPPDESRKTELLAALCIFQA